jgi:alpha-L-fucosidase 2
MEMNKPERRYLEELYFQYGRYLLIASSRAGTLPANLQGTWCMNKTAPWGGGYTCDENINMYYWPSFVTGLEETFSPYHDYFQATFDRCCEVATSWLGKHGAGGAMKGGWGTGNCDPYRVSDINEWTPVGVGPYVLQNLWTWYEFTDDKAVLEKIWPILLSSSRFLSSCLKEQPDGKLLCDPSYSPENPERRPEVKAKASPGYGQNRVCLPGTSFDQQMVYENFRMVLEAARILAKPDPILETLREQMTRLDPVQIGDSGQIKEFRQETSYGSIGDPKHRHISHLLGLYPFSLLTEKKEWMEGCRVTLNGRGDGATGWAVAHKISMWARLKDGERAYLLLNNLLEKSTLPNLWDTCPPFQIDGNSGGTAGMAEMLIQSHEGFIDLIPSLPKAWSIGSFTRLRARGAFIVSASWRDGQLLHLRVESVNGNPCKIRLGSGWNVVDQRGGQIKTSSDGNSGVVTFETTAGGNYILSKRSSFPSVPSLNPSRIQSP